MADSFVRISQLPEASQFSATDYLVIENDQDTWKVKMQHFDKYIKSKVDIYEQNIVTNVNSSLNEIQTVITETEQIINNINIKVENFANAEADRIAAEEEREQNEAIRQQNEIDRQNQANDILSGGQDMKAAEEARVAAENERKAAEAIRNEKELTRQQNEQNRILSETNRQDAEAIRVANENKRISNETNRQTNETDRINRFNEMEDTIDKFDTFIQNNSRYGRYYKEVTSNGTYLVLFEIALPKEHLTILDGETRSRKKYSALVYLSNTSNNEETVPSGRTFANIDIYMEVISSRPDLYEMVIHMDPLNLYTNSWPVGDGIDWLPYDYSHSIYNIAIYRMEEESCVIKIPIYLKPEYTGSVQASILWDNILDFKSSTSIYYSKAVPGVTMSSFGHTFVTQMTNPNPFSTEIMGYIGIAEANGKNNNHPYTLNDKIDSLPSGFNDLVKDIIHHVVSSQTSSEPYMSYPIGSIYISTSSANPGEYTSGGVAKVGALGGGTWELINNDGLAYNWTEVTKGTPQIGNTAGTPDFHEPKSETIYIWKRIG